VMRVMRRGVLRPKVVCLAYTSLALLRTGERSQGALRTDAFPTIPSLATLKGYLCLSFLTISPGTLEISLPGLATRYAKNS
jgi:hypothetical protein